MRLFRDKERVVAVIGYPSQGKTVFLAGMFWDSFFTLTNTFQDKRRPYSIHTLTEETGKIFYGNGKILNQGKLPPANPRVTPAPATLEFKGVPSANGRNRRRDIQLTFYDMSGELFRSHELLRQHAPFLPKTDDIIFIFDPTAPDFNNIAFEASELLDRMYNVVPKLRRKHFVVALSKMDELLTQDAWWQSMMEWHHLDYKSAPTDLPNYVREMEIFSSRNMLHSWWEGAGQAQNFINGLPRNTHYCALSALGHAPGWYCPNEECHTVNAKNETVRTFNATSLRTCPKCSTARGSAPLRLSRKPEPFRVRDPLFWIFREAGVM